MPGRRGVWRVLAVFGAFWIGCAGASPGPTDSEPASAQKPGARTRSFPSPDALEDLARSQPPLTDLSEAVHAAADGESEQLGKAVRVNRQLALDTGAEDFARLRLHDR